MGIAKWMLERLYGKLWNRIPPRVYYSRFGTEMAPEPGETYAEFMARVDIEREAMERVANMTQEQLRGAIAEPETVGISITLMGRSTPVRLVGSKPIAEPVRVDDAIEMPAPRHTHTMVTCLNLKVETFRCYSGDEAWQIAREFIKSGCTYVSITRIDDDG